MIFKDIFYLWGFLKILRRCGMVDSDIAATDIENWDALRDAGNDMNLCLNLSCKNSKLLG